ncbi:MAG: LuxR C-terminal-related transcriptional regulator [Planctomycetota bacterium]
MTGVAQHGGRPEAPDALSVALQLEPLLMQWSVDRNLRVLRVSERCARILLGCRPSQVEGAAIADVVPEPVVNRVREMLELVQRTGQPAIGRGVWGGQRYRTIYMPTENGMTCLTRPAPTNLPVDDAGEESMDSGFVELGELDRLSPRELEVLALLGEGLRIKDIAERIGRSYKTASSFRDSLGRKLGIADRCELVSLARSRGLEHRHATMPRISRRPAAV